MKAALAAYIIIGLLFGMWSDAMDRKYSTGKAPTNFGVAIALSLMWPLFMPMSMVAILYGGWGRWDLEK